MPFTVLLLLIGLVIGFLNREYGPHGSHHADDAITLETHEHGFFGELWAKTVDTLSGAITWGGNLDGHLIPRVSAHSHFRGWLCLGCSYFQEIFSQCFLSGGAGHRHFDRDDRLAFYGLVAAFGDPGGVLAEWSVEAGAFVWLSSMLFGAVVSATDPVAVVALLKELGASKKLGTLIEGESLLNDGTAIVAFVLLFGVVTGSQVMVTETGDFDLVGFLGNTAVGFGKIGAAGGLLGVLLGLLAILWVRKVFNDPLIEVTVVLATSFAVFFICEHFFHVSGVLGLVALGIVMAGVGKTRISPEVEHFMHEFWEFIAFVASVIIFIVVGVVIAQKIEPSGMGLRDFGACLFDHSPCESRQHGHFLPPHAKGWIRLASTRRGGRLVGCSSRSDRFGPCPRCLFGAVEVRIRRQGRWKRVQRGNDFHRSA